jgi:hypothetical protein
MLLAVGLSSGEPAIAEAAFLVFFALTMVVVVFMVARWSYGEWTAVKCTLDTSFRPWPGSRSLPRGRRDSV